MFPQQSFGYWLRLKRKSLDLTREGLAERVGCSAATVRKLEAEERRPSQQIAERLAEVFEIPENEREKFLRFARGEMALAPTGSPQDIAWGRTHTTARSNLPAPVTRLIGREKEIADLHERLSKTDARLITLIGPPGIGKTRLSIETARTSLAAFPDGAFLVEFAPLDDASHIAPTIAQTLGYTDKSNRPTRDLLKHGINDMQILLVLDNCEHLIEYIAPLASGLLSACSRLKILATSRESLRIPGEHLYPVPALELPKETASIDMDTAPQFPALTLFTERAHAVRPDFSLNAENVQAVVSICSQLDGLPLAIELIASRIRLLTPQALLERMSGQFVLSADGMRAVSARQKTLNNAIKWSYDSLPKEEQKLFAYLSVFSGGFTLEAAEAVFSGTFQDRAVSDIITSLSDRSLLVRSTDATSGIRFHMLFPIHEFASERLRQMSKEANTRDRHLVYFLDLAERVENEIQGSSQLKLLNQMDVEHDNFRAALGWSVSNQQTNHALRLLGALGWPWEMRCHYTEASDWLERVKTLPGILDHPAPYSKVLNHIGRHIWTQENFEEAHAMLVESLAIAASAGTDGEQSMAEALNWLGIVELLTFRDHEKAKAHLERGLEIYQTLGNQHGIALNTFHLGILELELGHYDQAFTILSRSLDDFKQAGNLFFSGRVYIYLGYLYMQQGHFDRSLDAFEKQLIIDTELQFWDGIANAWYHLGDLYRQKGETEKAKLHFEQCRLISREHGLTKTIPTIK